MKLKYQIPNLITLSNLLCGALAIYFTAQGMPQTGALLIAAGAFLDFFDGLTARWLGVQGELGKQLDSLADVISFGLAPAFIGISLLDGFQNPGLVTLFPLIMAPFSAYRLAKFNIDTRQTENFIGLPTPANALFWISFPLILSFNSGGILSDFYLSLTQNTWAVNILSLVFSLLLVSELPIFSLKFKSLAFGPNQTRYVFLVLSGVLLAIFWLQALPIIIVLYLIFSLIENLIAT